MWANMDWADVVYTSGCARASLYFSQIWVGYDGCGTAQAYRVVMRHRSASFFYPLVTEPCNQAYKGGLGCSGCICSRVGCSRGGWING